MRLIAFTIAAAATLAALYLIDAGSRATLRQVQEGQLALWCKFNDGRRQVPADKVTDFYEGRWYFTNGSAKNCEVTR